MHIKSFVKILMLFFLLVLLLSCGRTREELAALTAQRDTLLAQSERNLHELNDLHSYIEAMSSSLDSIAMEEGMLFLPDPENPNKKISKRQMQQRLEKFQELIERQRDRIKVLEDSLDITNSSFNNMKTLVAYFRSQIEQKEVEISKMKSELTSQKSKIVKLESKVADMQSDIDLLNADVDHLLDKSDKQREILDVQDMMLNEGYYIVKTRSELHSMGVRSQSISNVNLDLSVFTKVDIREFTSLKISANIKKIKILTQMPVGSYSFISNEDGTTILQIDSPVDFWSISKILIIQIR